MWLTHVELKEANDFVAHYHRHHKPVRGHRFSIGVQEGDELVGVAIVGRPVARCTDQKFTLEVTRLCTDGKRNACSFLYSACARAGKILGYKKIQTFTLKTEPGTSLVASGWSKVGETKGRSWICPGYRHLNRTDQPKAMGDKQKWSKALV